MSMSVVCQAMFVYFACCEMSPPLNVQQEDAAWPILKVPVVPVFATNLVGPGKIGLTVFHVGSLPTARLIFLCGSPLPIVLPPQLKAKTFLVV